MSIFLCAHCDQFRDSDDGCEEAPGFRLICAECATEAADEIEEQGRTPSQADAHT